MNSSVKLQLEHIKETMKVLNQEYKILEALVLTDADTIARDTTKAELKSLYYDQGLSMQQIATIKARSVNWVVTQMTKYNLPRRNNVAKSRRRI